MYDHFPILNDVQFWAMRWGLSTNQNRFSVAVDGRYPAPVNMVNIPIYVTCFFTFLGGCVGCLLSTSVYPQHWIPSPSAKFSGRGSLDTDMRAGLKSFGVAPGRIFDTSSSRGNPRGKCFSETTCFLLLKDMDLFFLPKYLKWEIMGSNILYHCTFEDDFTFLNLGFW